MEKGAVTFLDVLGWKGIWTRDDEAIAKLKGLIAAAREAVPRVLATGAEHIPELRGFDERRIQIESISDTIVLFTAGVAGATLWLHGALCQIIICTSIDRKIPVRGATSYGDYATDDRIMVGPGIDEAASWHESTDWIGVIQSPTAYLLYSHPAQLPRVWVPYPPPLKTGRVETYCVDWSRHWREVLGREEAQLKDAFTQMGPLDTSIAGKYLNALTFYRKLNPAPEGQTG
jgi:hypothetical protein